jgi:5'-deoxynucleotidase YfbR-like HD superfamily hydrolase
MTENEYRGAWMETYSGSKVHFRDPKPQEIQIRDIAHHLSLLCRFTGACYQFYSVADHSIRVAELVPWYLRLAALLHDAAEAYINDISRPVKYTHKLDETEAILTKVIDEKYGIDSRHPLIREADNIMIATEARDLMPNTLGWAELPEPLLTRIRPLISGEAERMFLSRFYEYGGKE